MDLVTIHIHYFRPAIYLLLAWAVMLIGTLLFILAALGVLPNNLLTYYAVQGGSALSRSMIIMVTRQAIRS